MYISRTTMTCTRTTVAASTFSTQYSGDSYNGCLHSVIVQASRAMAKGALWLFNESCTDVAVAKIGAPSTLVHEYLPRRVIYATSAASTGAFVDKLAFSNERLKVHVSASSDWHTYSTAHVNVKLYWEGRGKE